MCARQENKLKVSNSVRQTGKKVYKSFWGRQQAIAEGRKENLLVLTYFQRNFYNNKTIVNNITKDFLNICICTVLWYMYVILNILKGKCPELCTPQFVSFAKLTHMGFWQPTLTYHILLPLWSQLAHSTIPYLYINVWEL